MPTYTPFPVWPAPEGGEGGGVTSHGALTGRSSADQHPIDAITGLQTELDELLAGDTPPMFALYDPDDDIDLDAASGPTNGAVLFYGRSDNAEDGVYDVTVDDGYARRTIQPTAVIAIQVIDSAFDPLHASTDVAILIPDSPGGDNGWGVWGWFERVTPTSRGNLNRVFNVTSFAGDVVLSVNDGNSFYGPLSSDVTSVTLNDAVDGYEVQVILEITQDSSPHTITWGSAWNWAGGVAPTMSTGSGAVDVIVARTRDGGATIHASVMGQAFA